MIKYEAICRRCNSDFTFYRKDKMSPSHKPPKYCSSCRELVIGEKDSRRHRESHYVDSRGYIYIWIGNKYEPEHRVVMERMLGRKLREGESVHHKDGNKANNTPQNLELWLQSHLAGVRLSDLVCPHCGMPYLISTQNGSKSKSKGVKDESNSK